MTQSQPPVKRSAPLGPDSLLWKYIGDRRFYLLFGRIGLLESMHPAVGAALVQHSNFFDNPMDRLLRSNEAVMRSVYAADGDAWAEKIRDYHRDIKGTDAAGKRYHALNPEVFWWTHMTFVEMVIAINDLFDTPLNAAEKDQLVRESVTWWRRYGLSDRPVIDNYRDFQRAWQAMIEEGLERNQASVYSVEQFRTQRIPPPPGFPPMVWKAIGMTTMRASVWLTIGTLPARAREVLGVRWSRWDALKLRALCASVRRLWPLLPARVRYCPVAYQALYPRLATQASI